MYWILAGIVFWIIFIKFLLSLNRMNKLDNITNNIIFETYKGKQRSNWK